MNTKEKKRIIKRKIDIILLVIVCLGQLANLIPHYGLYISTFITITCQIVFFLKEIKKNEKDAQLKSKK